MKKPKVNALFFLPENGTLRARFRARTGCRPQNRLGVQEGCAEIYAGSSQYGYRIFWGDMIAASGGGANRSASLLTALKWAMGAYVRAFDTCQECRDKR